jgi:hypothetical protein
MSNVFGRPAPLPPPGAPLAAGAPDAVAVAVVAPVALVFAGAALAAAVPREAAGATLLGAALAREPFAGAADWVCPAPPVIEDQLLSPPAAGAVDAAGAALAVVPPRRGAPRCCANAVAPIATIPSERPRTRARMVRKALPRRDSRQGRTAILPRECAVNDRFIAIRRAATMRVCGVLARSKAYSAARRMLRLGRRGRSP